MPSNMIKSFATKTNKSESEIESIYKKAKSVSKEKGYEDDEEYTVGIMKKMLKIEEMKVDEVVNINRKSKQFPITVFQHIYTIEMDKEDDKVLIIDGEDRKGKPMVRRLHNPTSKDSKELYDSLTKNLRKVNIVLIDKFFDQFQYMNELKEIFLSNVEFEEFMDESMSIIGINSIDELAEKSGNFIYDSLSEYTKLFLEKEENYDDFFEGALEKFGVDSPDELSGEKKKEFFDYVDSNWESDDEEKGIEESHTFEESTLRHLSSGDSSSSIQNFKEMFMYKLSQNKQFNEMQEEMSFLHGE